MQANDCGERAIKYRACHVPSLQYEQLARAVSHADVSFYSLAMPVGCKTAGGEISGSEASFLRTCHLVPAQELEAHGTTLVFSEVASLE